MVFNILHWSQRFKNKAYSWVLDYAIPALPAASVLFAGIARARVPSELVTGGQPRMHLKHQRPDDILAPVFTKELIMQYCNLTNAH